MLSVLVTRTVNLVSTQATTLGWFIIIIIIIVIIIYAVLVCLCSVFLFCVCIVFVLYLCSCAGFIIITSAVEPLL
jgi:hypothetical protein